MMAKVDVSGSQGAPNALLVSAAGGAPVTLPEGISLADAAFSRAGGDLVVTAPGHLPVVIRDFFTGDAPPALVTTDGSQISGDLAARLAGPEAAGKYAAAGVIPETDAIGRIESVAGNAFVIHADGTREQLGLGSHLYAGDILETGADGAIGILLADETSMSMGGDGRMVLDEMIYDPSTQEGSMALSVLKGVYTIVSGMVSKTDPDAMVIDTPVGSIGIRGTQIGLEIPDGQNLNIVMMREEDGYVGEVFIHNEAGLQVMNQPHQVVFIGGFDHIPTFAPSVDEAGVLRMFHTTLSYLPKASGRENDYSAPDIRQPGGIENFQTDAGQAHAAAPADPIRVIEGDYTQPKIYESSGIPAPAAPEAAPETTTAPTPVEPRTDDVVVQTDNLAVVSNDAPVALDVKATTAEDQPLAGQLTAADANADTLTFGLAGDGGPKHGSVTVNADGTFAYVPDPDFSGIDTFTYTVSDGRGGVALATATVEVTAVPDVPELSVGAASGLEDSAIPILISATVAGKEELASLIIGGVPKGAKLSAGADNGDGTWTLAGADLDDLGTLTITPPSNSSEDFALKVTATSTDGGVATAEFTVTVAPVADLPTLQVENVTIAGDDTSDDGQHRHHIHGSWGDDFLSGGSGSDRIHGGAGADILYGDAALVGAATVPLHVQAALADADGSESLGVTIAGVPDGVTLSAGVDNGDGTWSLQPDELEGLQMTVPEGYRDDFELQVTATATDTDVDSDAVDSAATTATISVAFAGDEGGGDDVIKGGSGDDVLHGGGGNDRLEGGEGSDVLFGGSGNDTLEGGEGADLLFGGSGDDKLDGGAGNDVLIGGSGHDSLDGGSGNDALFGGAGNDVLKGGAGDDVLVGGAGNDVLEGGSGNDVFVFASGAGKDIIKDYHEGEVLRFEGPEFSEDKLSVTQDGDDVKIMFGDQNTEVTLSDVDLKKTSYSVTHDHDAVVITFDDDK